MRFAKIFLLVLCFCAGVLCRAQRQTPGRPSIDATFTFDPIGKGVYGGSVMWSNYQYLGHTSLGLEAMSHPYYYTLPEVVLEDGTVVAEEERLTLRCVDVTAGGGYFIRIVGTRSRSVILSAGINGFIGVRHCSGLSEYTKKKTGLLMYLVPELQLEVFPFSNVSLFVSVRPRMEVLNVVIAGAYPWFNLNFGAGLKVYL